MKIELTVDAAMRAYNWFHHSYPSYKTNEWCTHDEILLRDKLERFLIASGR